MLPYQCLLGQKKPALQINNRQAGCDMSPQQTKHRHTDTETRARASCSPQQKTTDSRASAGTPGTFYHQFPLCYDHKAFHDTARCSSKTETVTLHVWGVVQTIYYCSGNSDLLGGIQQQIKRECKQTPTCPFQPWSHRWSMFWIEER